MSEQFTELGRIVTKLNEMSFTDDRAEALLTDDGLTKAKGESENE